MQCGCFTTYLLSVASLFLWVLGVFLLKSCETFSFFLSLCMVRALFTNVSLFTFLEDNYELFCVSLYYTYMKFLLSFLFLSVSLLFQYLNLCFFLCVLGFVGTKFCTALSLCLWWVFYKRNFVCVFLTLSIYLWWATSV